MVSSSHPGSPKDCCTSSCWKHAHVQGKRSLQAHGRVSSPSSWLLSPTPVANHAAGRAFSTGSTPGEAAAAAAAASVDDAKKVAGGVFPWRNAPDQVVAPAGSGSPLDDIVESIFEEYCLKGVDFKAGNVHLPCNPNGGSDENLVNYQPPAGTLLSVSEIRKYAVTTLAA